MSRLRMAVVGVGHLGKAHARVLAGLPDVELVGVVDIDLDQAQSVADQYGTRAFSSHLSLVDQVDAASIVVPTTFHSQVAETFLQKNIPLMVEKPLAASLTEAEYLVRLAHQQDVLLQVGHIERFNPAFEALVAKSFQPKFIEAQRVGPFTGRSTDIGVVLDLMIHDLDLLLQLVGSPVQRVEGMGINIFGQHEDVATARLYFANGCVANVTASRSSPSPFRQMNIWAPEGFSKIDFAKRQLTLIQPSQDLRAQGLDISRLDSVSRTRLKDDLFGRHFEVCHLDCNQGDQLTKELSDFVHCVRTNTKPRVSGEDGLTALSLAHRVLDSIDSHRWEGQPDGPKGPEQFPLPLGPLFSPISGEAAA